MSDIQELIDLEKDGNYVLADDAQKEYDNLLEWKRAIEDACIVDWVIVTTPQETIQNLIAWNIKMALDPKISEEAQKLIEQGRNQRWA